jgi:hypothetical protein
VRVVTRTARGKEALLQHRLVDECLFWLFPVIAGSGERLYDGIDTTDFDLIDVRRLSNGILGLTYAPAAGSPYARGDGVKRLAPGCGALVATAAALIVRARLNRELGQLAHAEHSRHLSDDERVCGVTAASPQDSHAVEIGHSPADLSGTGLGSLGGLSVPRTSSAHIGVAT